MDRTQHQQWSPWTEDQVASLNAYQASPSCLPFLDEKGLPLLATTRGWVRQGTDEIVDRWAYHWMLDGTWRKPIRPTGNTGTFELQGALFVMNRGEQGEEPYIIYFPQSKLRYLPCFTTEDKLWSFMNYMLAPVDNIKIVGNPKEFLESLREAEVEAIQDPYFTPEGKIRFLQVQGAT